jgi:flagellar hook-associated protein 3 FlgL
MMRISNAQITALMHNSMNRSSGELGKLMQQMSTGERLTLPSDDPIASVRIMRVQRAEASLTQYSKNISNVSSSLSIQEANLTSTSDALLNARDLLVWAANGSNTSDDLGAMAGELQIIHDTLISFVNARDEEGRYLFSGTLSNTQALSLYASTQSYSVTGNAKQRQAVVGNGVQVNENVTAMDIFGANAELFNQLSGLLATLQNPALDSTDPSVRQQVVATMNSLDSSLNRLSGAITEIGGRQNALSLLKSSNEDVSLVNQKIEGELSELDYAGASIDLSNYQMSLEATQKTYLKINNLSLFSLL